MEEKIQAQTNASTTKVAQRQPMVMLVCGETGVGKTYRNKQEIRRYLKDDEALNRKGRKVLAFDTNDDDYPEFRTVNPEHLHQLKSIYAEDKRRYRVKFLYLK